MRLKLGRQNAVITLKRECCGDHACASNDGAVVENCVHARQTGMMHEHDAVHELKVQRGCRAHVSFSLCRECREIEDATLEQSSSAQNKGTCTLEASQASMIWFSSSKLLIVKRTDEMYLVRITITCRHKACRTGCASLTVQS